MGNRADRRRRMTACRNRTAPNRTLLALAVRAI
jgi:hypothetical protein